MALSFPSQSFRRFGSIVGITKGGEKKTIEFEDDQNLFELLTGAGVISPEGTCNGNVACGKCLVKVVSGNVAAAEDEEKELLDGAPAGARLACAISLDSGANGATFQAL
ncbi:Ferredoxin [Tritrichomonas foetus]|uniref:Ferredoxin n=2 Tax=Tritrichomonas TaxID=5723 RepID=A0A1J4JIM9_9EUKA|nr:ferredoxin [Tritrichomonas foetus]ARM19926.1 ferredoxin [Tritrichomonas foetus]OHS98990.1 Ferredoxin [Tritrichomonas foetus]|eukprot:OHS98990.1 Ferredoxin [Tritrichomonas foetus]